MRGSAADPLPHALDVGADALGEIGEFVHERDARREHRVGRVLRQLGGPHVHHDHAFVVALERLVELPHQLRRAVVVRADDDAVGLQEVLDGRAFLQELGVRDDGEFLRAAALGKLVGDGLAHAVGRADGHRGLVDDDAVVVEMAADVPGRGGDVREIGRAVLAGRRADGDELDVAVRHALRDVGREPQATGLDVALHHGLEARFVDGDAARLEHGDLAFVEVETQDIVARVREARAGHESDVARTYYCHSHCGLLGKACSPVGVRRDGDRRVPGPSVPQCGRHPGGESVGRRREGWRNPCVRERLV
jgi:hypothetical protein